MPATTDVFTHVAGGLDAIRPHSQPRVRLTLPDGSAVDSVAAALERNFSNIRASAERNNVLSVTLLPESRIGTSQADLKQVTFILEAFNAARELEMIDMYSWCCGNGGGCCVN